MDSLKIGNITLPHRAVFGPMAGFTDAPCRRLMAQHGAGFTVSEMVSSRALVYHDHKTVSLLKAEPNGAPYGVQIFGEVPQIMGEAAAAIEEYQFDFLDINMGCPAPKIVSGGAGSKLMLDPDLCGRIVEQVKAHTTRPVTVKMRKGWDADHITAVECAKACEQAGAELIAVHARTREQMYTPGIDPDIIAKVKAAVKVPVLGNGDIHTAEDAVEMMQRTGCDGVMIARAALGDPWLFERANAAIEGLPTPKEPNLQARMNALRRQVEEMVEQKGEYTAMPQARAQTMHYMKGLKGAAALRRCCCTLSRLEDLDELIAAVFEEQRKAGLDPDDVREVPFPCSFAAGQLVEVLGEAGEAVRHEPVGLGAVHPFQCLPLLTKRGVELVVAAALLLHALDKGREPVSGFQEPLFLGGQQAAGDEGADLLGQLRRQQTGHGIHALGLQRLVGVPQAGAAVLDRRGHIAGDDLGCIVIERRHRHRLGAAGRAGVPPRDEAEGMGQQGSVAGVLAEGFRAGGVHQTPPGDVLHPRQKGAERV